MKPTPTAGAGKPVEKLVGMQLENGLTVVKCIEKHLGATGSHFSIGYKVQNQDGSLAFLKAIDFSGALAAADPTRAMQLLTETYNFERDLLEKCRAKNLNRVVRALEEGKVELDGMPVPYLIFELADGDMRAHMDLSDALDLAWTQFSEWRDRVAE